MGREIGTHQLEDPERPQGLQRPKGTADDVQYCHKRVITKCLYTGEKTCVAPCVCEGQWWRYCRPYTENDMDSVHHEEPHVCECTVLHCCIVDPHVPAAKASVLTGAWHDYKCRQLQPAYDLRALSADTGSSNGWCSFFTTRTWITEAPNVDNHSPPSSDIAMQAPVAAVD